MAVTSSGSVLFLRTLVSQLLKSASFELLRCLAASGIKSLFS